MNGAFHGYPMPCRAFSSPIMITLRLVAFAIHNPVLSCQRVSSPHYPQKSANACAIPGYVSLLFSSLSGPGDISQHSCFISG